MSHSTDPLAWVRPDVVAMSGYTPGEQRADVLKLNTNESAWGPSPGVRAVLAAFAEERLRLYPDPVATQLREAAAARYGAHPDQVLAGNGSDDCLTILFRTHLRPGDRAAVPWPTYGLYQHLADVQGVELCRVDYLDRGPAGAWRLPDLTGAGARVVIVANPNNPSGTLVPVADLRRLADALDGVLVVDEAYVEFAPAEASMLPWLDAHPNLVVLRTLSKSFGLAGVRLGLLFAHRDLVAQYRKVKDSYNVNAVTQAVGVAALEDRAWHRGLVERTVAARGALEDDLADLGWRSAPSAANFLLSDAGAETRPYYEGLRAAGILVRWWDTPVLRNRLRITVGRPDQNARLIATLRDLS